MGNNALPEFERANVGDYVKFGRYPQTDEGEGRSVEWRVLAIENNRVLVISRYGLDARPFDPDSNDWSESEIRKWLNGEFYNSTFSDEEKARIKSFNQDNVFLLSEKEAERYFANRDARKCKPTSYAKAKGAWKIDDYCWWWLRSPYPNFSKFVYSVNFGGVIDDNFLVNNKSLCARPALWVSLEF